MDLDLGFKNRIKEGEAIDIRIRWSSSEASEIIKAARREKSDKTLTRFEFPSASSKYGVWTIVNERYTVSDGASGSFSAKLQAPKVDNEFQKYGSQRVDYTLKLGNLSISSFSRWIELIDARPSPLKVRTTSWRGDRVLEEGKKLELSIDIEKVSPEDRFYLEYTNPKDGLKKIADIQTNPFSRYDDVSRSITIPIENDNIITNNKSLDIQLRADTTDSGRGIVLLQEKFNIIDKRPGEIRGELSSQPLIKENIEGNVRIVLSTKIINTYFADSIYLEYIDPVTGTAKKELIQSPSSGISGEYKTISKDIGVNLENDLKYTNTPREVTFRLKAENSQGKPPKDSNLATLTCRIADQDPPAAILRTDNKNIRLGGEFLISANVQNFGANDSFRIKTTGKGFQFDSSPAQPNKKGQLTFKIFSPKELINNAADAKFSLIHEGTNTVVSNIETVTLIADSIIAPVATQATPVSSVQEVNIPGSTQLPPLPPNTSQPTSAPPVSQLPTPNTSQPTSAPPVSQLPTPNTSQPTSGAAVNGQPHPTGALISKMSGLGYIWKPSNSGEPYILKSSRTANFQSVIDGQVSNHNTAFLRSTKLASSGNIENFELVLDSNKNQILDANDLIFASGSVRQSEIGSLESAKPNQSGIESKGSVGFFSFKESSLTLTYFKIDGKLGIFSSPSLLKQSDPKQTPSATVQATSSPSASQQSAPLPSQPTFTPANSVAEKAVEGKSKIKNLSGTGYIWPPLNNGRDYTLKAFSSSKLQATTDGLKNIYETAFIRPTKILESGQIEKYDVIIDSNNNQKPDIEDAIYAKGTIKNRELGNLESAISSKSVGFAAGSIGFFNFKDSALTLAYNKPDNKLGIFGASSLGDIEII